jgi:TonB family protein
MKKRILFIISIISFSFSTFPAQTPTPTAEKTLSAEVINGKALSLPKPAYPAAAAAVRASGAVNVQITIDENGKVISAAAVSGHPLLRGAAEQAARLAKFSPTLLSGQPVKITGILVYDFAGSILISWDTVAIVLLQAESDKLYDESRLKEVASQLPEGFESEAESIQTLVKNLKGMKKSDLRKEEIDKIVKSIQGKLRDEPILSLRFDLQLIIYRIKGNLEKDSLLRANLLKLQELIDSKRTDILSEKYRNKLKEAADYAKKSDITTEDKEKIAELLY